MTMDIKPVPAGTVEITEAQVDEAVAACDGDARATVRALLVGQAKLRERISAGYERRLPLAKLSDVQGK